MNRLQKLIVGIALVLMGIATFGLIPFVYVQYEYQGGEFLVFGSLSEREAQEAGLTPSRVIDEGRVERAYVPIKRPLEPNEINPFPAYGCVFAGLLFIGYGLFIVCSKKK